MCMALMQLGETLLGDDSDSAKLAFKCITCAARSVLSGWYEFDLFWIQIKILMFFRLAKSVRVAKINSAMAERETA